MNYHEYLSVSCPGPERSGNRAHLFIKGLIISCNFNENMLSLLTTPRLIIREAGEADATFVFELLNSPTWIRFIGDRGIHRHQDAVHYIRNSMVKSYREQGFGLYLVSLKGQTPVGVCGFLRRNYLDHPDIGFAMLPAYEGRGLMKEAASAVLEYGFSVLGFSRVYAITNPDNKRSQALLTVLGFQFKKEFQPPGMAGPVSLFYFPDDNAGD